MGNDGVEEIEAAPACLMTIFGASGDLTKRLLLPSLYNLAAIKALSPGFQLLGVAMEDWNDDRFRDHITQSLKQFWGADAKEEVIGWLTSRARYQSGRFDSDQAFDQLKTRVESIESKGQTGGNRMFYFAVAPGFVSTIADQLARTCLSAQGEGCWRRIVVEKPFGHDLASARALNEQLHKHLTDDQIFRIDHFAGKDAVQDLAVFRFSNAIFEPIWNRGAIDNVQITAAETVGVEQRAGYYEGAGALRDMVPNHLAEVLSLVAMEPPASFNANHMRAEQVKLLESICPIRVADVAKSAVRGQYGAGTLEGKPVVGYREEPGVQPQSSTETYVAMQLFVENWRWAGVPFYMRTGKRLCEDKMEIVVTFKQAPARLFPYGEQSDQTPNRIVFNLKPNQGIRLTFGSKMPGLKTLVQRSEMSYSFSDRAFGSKGKGYERLLRDVMMGNATLFPSADFVEKGWAMVQPMLEAWSDPAGGDPVPYPAGCCGPAAADELLAATERSWHSLEDE